MCYAHNGNPYLLPMWSPQHERAYAALIYGKVTELQGGVHRTSLDYPLQRQVWDPRAVYGDHDRCIHLLGNPDVAGMTDLSSYGSHVLAMLPIHRLWSKKVAPGRCWHVDGVTPLLCMTCEGIELETLALPEFQREFAMQNIITPEFRRLPELRQLN
jgi:hypothetical protein